MAKEEFPEKVKEEAKRKAAFKCVLCHEKPAFHVHHIDPKGENDIDNSAPLCYDCHGSYAHDPTHRKIIRQARDWWFEHVEKTYESRKQELEHLEKISQEMVTKEDFGKTVQALQQNLQVVTESIKANDIKKAKTNLYTIGTEAIAISGSAVPIEGQEE